MARQHKLETRLDTSIEALELKAVSDRTRESLWRMGSWALMTIVITTGAVMLARTEQGQRNLTTALTLQAPAKAQDAGRVQQASAPDPMAVYETRRLAEHVRLLSAERDALAGRLETLERNMGDVTASISRAKPVKPADPAVNAAPVREIVATSAAAQESQAIRTEFGVDLAGGETSVDALRNRWAQLRSQHALLLEGLKPLVSIVDGAKPGTVELRLVAGPLSNANIAARLCVSLGNAGAACKPTVYDGQRLALQ